MNHGINRVPAGFDPKRGLLETEYEGLISRDHAATADELHELAKSNVRPGNEHIKQWPLPRVGSGFSR